VDYSDFLAAIPRDGERLAAAAETAGLNTPVPSCPGWTVADLVEHTGEVHRDKERIVRPRLQEAPTEPIPGAGDRDLLEWYREGLDLLMAALIAVDPADPVYTWHKPDQTSGFWMRRMAHETLIHRIDAELAAGDVTEVDDGLGADGSDEILDVMMLGYPGWAEWTPREEGLIVYVERQAYPLRLGSWSGTTRSGNVYTDEPAAVLDRHVEITTEIEGSGSAVDLWLWGRGRLEDLTVTGDASLAHELRALAAASTQ
jgi:uncharacterized protein (TIGR03083 family)